MTSLPEADAATRAFFVDWLERFSGYVREVDYAAARPLFHPDVLAFGTHRDVIPGLAAWQATQWDNVWPKTSDFRFDTAAARVLASADNTMATVVVPTPPRAPITDNVRGLVSLAPAVAAIHTAMPEIPAGTAAPKALMPGVKPMKK